MNTKNNNKSIPCNITGGIMWILVALYAIPNTVFNIAMAYRNGTNITTFEFTEFLVNYSSGYIRRGLVGELLYWFTFYTNLDPRWFIVPMCVIAYACVVTIILYACKKQSYCPWAMVYVIFSALAFHGAFRKDYLIFLIVSGILYVLFNNRFRAQVRLFIALFLYCLGIQIHECIFFMIAPFLILYFVRKDGNWNINFKSCFLSLFVIGFMAMISLHKGSVESAQVIHDTWAAYFGDEFGKKPSGTIMSLGWTTAYAINMHLDINFFNHADKILPGWLIFLLLLVSMIYIMPNITLPRSEDSQELMYNKRKLFLFLLIFQMVVLLPMFIFLSCDVFRITTYWLISTFLLYAFVPKEILSKLIPSELDSFLSFVMNNVFYTGSHKMAMIMLLFVGIPAIGYDFNWAIWNSPIARYCELFYRIFSSL